MVLITDKRGDCNITPPNLYSVFEQKSTVTPVPKEYPILNDKITYK